MGIFTSEKVRKEKAEKNVRKECYKKGRKKDAKGISLFNILRKFAYLIFLHVANYFICI